MNLAMLLLTLQCGDAESDARAALALAAVKPTIVKPVVVDPIETMSAAELHQKILDDAMRDGTFLIWFGEYANAQLPRWEGRYALAPYEVKISGPWHPNQDGSKRHVHYQTLTRPTRLEVQSALETAKATWQTERTVSIALPKEPTPSRVQPADGDKYAAGQRQTRAARGHTHTHCGVTWDHAENPTHQCPVCGRAQYVIDQPSRPVTILNR